MHRISTFAQRLGDILLLSLRPVQLMLAMSALIVAISVVASFIVRGPTVVYLYDFCITVNAWVVAAIFSVYAGSSVYCSMAMHRAGPNLMIRYGTTVVGIVIWTIAFVLEVLLNSTMLVGLRIIPIFAEGLIIAQLMSDVRSQDRRAL